MSYKGSSETYNKTKDLLSSARGATNNKLKMNNLEEKLEVSETMIQALWKLLQKQGITRDDLGEAVSEVLEDRKKYKHIPVEYKCPTCGKTMQVGIVSPFIAKCVYCNEEVKVLPFDKYEQREVVEEVVAPVEDSSTDKPYNLDDDLSFDDLM